jgi:hypothetical protein
MKALGEKGAGLEENDGLKTMSDEERNIRAANGARARWDKEKRG